MSDSESNNESDNKQLIRTKGWSEEECLELIREYREREILWNPSNPKYYKTAVKAKEWLGIGKKLRKPADACKAKIGILLSSFRREKSKILNSFAKGEVYTSVWFGFKDMAFLMERDIAGKRKLRRIEYQKELNQESDECDDEDAFDDPMPDVKPKIQKTESVLDVAQISPDDYHEISSDQSRNVTTSHFTEIEDNDITTFLSFIGNKMRKYSEPLKVQVQREICDVIFKTDQTHYNTNKDPLSKIQKVDNCDCICCTNRKY